MKSANPFRTLLGWWVLLAVAGCLGCSKDGALPGDTDPAKPWAPASTQQSPLPAAAGIVDDEVFSVESVMANQHALGITPEQKAAILKELDQSQVEFNRLEWELHGEKEKLATSLSPEKVDEVAALEAGQRVTDAEGKLKLAHLRLLVRVKNQLTPNQQSQLRHLPR